MEQSKSGPSAQQGVAEEIKDIKEDLAEMQRVMSENNTLIKRVHRSLQWGFWLRVLWYGVLIGLPFAFYFYVLEPYFTALGSNYETFSAGIQEIPGWKQLNELFQESAHDAQ